jgi:uncharacterized membrane protein
MKNNFLPKERFSTLIDGVVAIIMTLVVLSIQVPELKGALSNQAFLNVLISLKDKFIVYLVTFVVLASIWNSNAKQMNYMKFFDKKMFALKIIWLFFITLIPFSATFLSNHNQYLIPNLFFNINIFVIALLSTISWQYIIKFDFIKEKPIKNTDLISIRSILFLLCTMAAIALSFIAPRFSSLAYLFPNIIIFIAKKINPNLAK